MAYATRSPGLTVVHTGAHRFHHARRFAARSERQIGLVEPRAEVDVDKINARGRDTDERLPGSRRGDRRIGESEFFRAAELSYLNEFHVRMSFRRRNRRRCAKPA